MLLFYLRQQTSLGGQNDRNPRHSLGKLSPSLLLHSVDRVKFYKPCFLRTDRLHDMFWTFLLSNDDDDDDDDCMKTVFTPQHNVVGSILFRI